MDELLGLRAGENILSTGHREKGNHCESEGQVSRASKVGMGLGFSYAPSPGK